MADPTHFDPDRIRVVLDHGEAVELDDGTLILDGEQSPNVVLRLAPWRARSVARVLREWSSVSQIFHQPARPRLDELEPSRTLENHGRDCGNVDLVVVDGIEVSRDKATGEILATGGTMRVWTDWSPAEEALTARRFTYTLPG